MLGCSGGFDLPEASSVMVGDFDGDVVAAVVGGPADKGEVGR